MRKGALTTTYLVLLLIVAVLMIQGCSKPASIPQNGTGESQGSKELIVYGWAGDWDLWFQKWAEEFKKETGVTIKYISGPGTQMRQRIITENAAKSDIFISTPSDAFTLAGEGMLADIPWDQIPASKDVDKRFKYPQVGIWGYDLHLIAYNTNLVKAGEAPQKWADFADPKWKGKLALSDPTDETATRHLLVMQKAYGTEKAWDLITKQYQNTVKLFNTPGDMERTIATGEAAIAAESLGQVMVATQQAGGKVAAVVPEEGAFLMLNSISIMKNAPHKDAAVKFVNFYLDKYAQNDIMNNLGISIATNSTVELKNDKLKAALGDKTIDEVLEKAYVPDWAYWIGKDANGKTRLANLQTELEARIKK
ncbi:extracellular solute-binding protein [Moorella naiadis]|uniref:ABC transporter substrate-binding protein n=1 Tax=Moorella naiadis (nom. illeg.) TaxID=3093670 RepID=UPI003D9CBDC4